MRKLPKALVRTNPSDIRITPAADAANSSRRASSLGRHHTGASLLGCWPIRAWRMPGSRQTSRRVSTCGITTARQDSLHLLRSRGGGNVAGSNVLVGGPKGQLDFLSVAGYSKLGLPGTMVPNPAPPELHRQHFRPAVPYRQRALRGIKARTGASAMANTNGAVIPRCRRTTPIPIRTIRCTAFISSVRGAVCSIHRCRARCRAAVRWRRRRW